MKSQSRPKSALDHIGENDDKLLPNRPHSALDQTASNRILSSKGTTAEVAPSTSVLPSSTTLSKTVLRPESAKRIHISASGHARPGSALQIRETPKYLLGRSTQKTNLERPSSALAAKSTSSVLTSNKNATKISKEDPASLRPSSALAKFHTTPSEQNQNVQGTTGTDGNAEDPVFGLEKQGLLNRVREILAHHTFVPETEKKIVDEKLQVESDSDDAEEFETIVLSKARQVFDLRPSEMARLNKRFPPGGLTKTDFEQVMREFTGMDVDMGSQLFCKIDANDDGTICWDEFLTYVVQVRAFTDILSGV
jgi:hypothetical protein